MASFFNPYHQRIEEICKTFRVKSLFAFGSAVRDELTAESDIDFLVDIAEKDPFRYTEYYFGLKNKLEQLFSRPVDLLENNSLKNPYLKGHIEKTKVLLYGAWH